MTCASCANRIERKLDGVTATVNYATEKAKVTFDEGVDPQELIAEVEKTGYTAALPPTPQSETTPGEPQGDLADELQPLRQRLIISVVLAVPVIAMAMIPGAAVHQLAVAVARPGRLGRGLRGLAPSTGPPGPTCATAPPPWTPWSRSARSPRSAGRCGRCSSAARVPRV